MRTTVLTKIVVLLGATAAFGSAVAERPTRVVSIHYPCMALKARIEGNIRIHCSIGPDGACSNAKIVSGHPLFYMAALENAKKWRFPPLKSGAQSRAADIDYRFEIRGIRAPEDKSDVEVTFEFPNTVIVVAPFDGKVPCRVPAAE
jgi:TonB family protein